MDEEDKKQLASRKIEFRFCRECTNLLYPRADDENNHLMFACTQCAYVEDANTPCVYRNSLQEQIAETAGNIDDVAEDPTVGDDSYMVSAVDSFMSDAYHDDDGESDSIPALCTYCGRDIVCPYCGGATNGGLTFEVDDPDAKLGDEKEEELVQAERRERALSSAAPRQQAS